MSVQRFDFVGTTQALETTPQGFVRVDARLTRTGIFTYTQDGKVTRELRLPEEVFRCDSLKSIAGAPVTDLHPDTFVCPENAKELAVGFAGEDIKPDGDFVTAKLTITDAAAIEGLKEGSRKEISLGYTCEIEDSPGIHNGEPYDSIQRNIVVNHIALGPKGWGRAGPEVSVKTDSDFQKRVTERVKLIQKCQKYLTRIDEQSDRDLKIAVVQKALPDFDLTDAEDLYVDGLFDAVTALNDQRNDSLAKAQLAIANASAVTQRVKVDLWTQPLASHL
ncbi:MAG: DUF2213 domain-containing protein [Myxococcaceae bacterium]